MARRFMTGAMVAAVVMSASALVFGHAHLEKTVPAANATLSTAPKDVQLIFSEAPDEAVSKIDIKGPSDTVKLVQTHVMGKTLMAHVDGEMTDGLYTVSWQTAGDDGHTQKGEFAFTLKLSSASH